MLDAMTRPLTTFWHKRTMVIRVPIGGYHFHRIVLPMRTNILCKCIHSLCCAWYRQCPGDEIDLRIDYQKHFLHNIILYLIIVFSFLFNTVDYLRDRLTTVFIQPIIYAITHLEGHLWINKVGCSDLNSCRPSHEKLNSIFCS